MDLIPPALAGFWPGHSSRHFLVSVAAAIGVGKDDRDDVGRWGIARKTEAHGSTDYVFSVKQTILATQERSAGAFAWATLLTVRMRCLKS